MVDDLPMEDARTAAPTLVVYEGEPSAEALEHYRGEELRLRRLGHVEEATKAYAKYLDTVNAIQGPDEAARVAWTRFETVKMRNDEEIRLATSLLATIANQYSESPFAARARSKAVKLVNLMAFDVDAEEARLVARIEKISTTAGADEAATFLVNTVAEWPSTRRDVRLRVAGLLSRYAERFVTPEGQKRLSTMLDRLNGRLNNTGSQAYGERGTGSVNHER